MLDIRVIMVEPTFEETIGFVARAMKNFGLNSLHLVNPVAELAVNGRMRGGHAQEILDTITLHNSLQEALAGLDLTVGTTAQRAHSSKNLLRRPITPRGLADIVHELSGKVGLVFGREGTGLNNRELSLCDTILIIPASEAYQTLNLSHAAVIVFYEIYTYTAIEAKDDLATEEVRQAILRFLSESLTRAGLHEHRIGLTARALKNIMGRSAIRRREASIIAGALRQVSAVLSKNGA
jgi:tRNA/rRNA methyltransferase